jgi:hypothetical protein
MNCAKEVNAMKRVLLALALLGLVAGANAVPGDLSDGVLIAHAPAGFIYSAGLDYCAEYAQYGIATCEEQINTTPITSSVLEPTLWYAIAAWNEDKLWCGTEFGFGTGFQDLWYFVEFGPCLINALENSTGGWPGSGQGTAVVATDIPWEGNFLATYYFIGYGYYQDIIPLDVDPAMNFAGFGNCEVPADTWDAVCLGAMGIGTEGAYCCPPAPGEPWACCFQDGSCLMMFEYDCYEAGGIEWMGEGVTCDDDPYPCEVPPEPGACCDPNTGDCYFILEVDCDAIGGDFLGEGVSCDPNPCPPPPIGACCINVYECFELSEYECGQQNGDWMGLIPCDPDPCPTPADDTSWGSIKALYK